MTPRRLRTAVLISGRGSNLGALVAAARTPDFPAGVVLVLSNVREAAGLRLAAAEGIAAEAIPHRAFASRAGFEDALHAALTAHGIEIVCLAGFMRLLTANFVERWSGRILSIHPALLPAFKGLDTHARALDAGVKIHGCTVHHVVPELDAGPIVAQAAVPVLPDDTPDRLASRVLVQEHVIYPRALRIVAAELQRPRGAAAPSPPTFDPGAVLVAPDGP